ncbi:MAG TPA: GatB/YqeY domain-containing protein, partial [Coriobacteriia bacterium]|nr:GatB/YqeY domain-containing protein [Coriobacteriia bacterium]
MDRGFICDEITKAMRAHDRPRLAILRLVKNEIDIKEKDAKREVTDEEVVTTLKKVLKQTGETLEASIKVGTDADRPPHLALALKPTVGQYAIDHCQQRITGDLLRQVG